MTVTHLDVLVVGAGLSGICAARYLQLRCPERSWAILEARSDLGGTWDLFRYPGVRSDSDMYTLGYSFRPWKEARAVVDGPSILAYLRETAEEYGIDERIRYGRRVERARWSSADGRWTVEVRDTATDQVEVLTCGFLWACAGYYRYDRAHVAELPGIERFGGEVVHPQFWGEDVAWADRRVVVVGSGATAVTLVPAMAEDAAHVTMLQRSPTFMVSSPTVDRVASRLQRVLPERLAYRINRWRYLLYGIYTYRFARRWPERARALVLADIRRALGDATDVETHFNPRYDIWDQRVCLVPDGDLFEAIRAGRVDVVTDEIQTFTETGIALKSGRTLEADLVVTATGLEMQVLGGVALEVDGELVDASERLMYRGAMLSGVPNAAACLGYVNASWTLKCELTCAWVCRLLNHMEAHGYTRCVPRPPDPDAPTLPFMNLSSGYVRRAAARLPRQGVRWPWRIYDNYLVDQALFRTARIDDGVLDLG